MKYFCPVYYLLILVFVITVSSNAQRDSVSMEKTNSYSVNPFTDFLKNSGECFTGKNLLFHVSGIWATSVIVSNSMDKDVHNYFIKNGQYEQYSAPAVHLGSVAPFLLGGIIWIYGFDSKKDREKTIGSAVLQACAVSFLYASTLKLFTGRPNPKAIEYKDNSYANNFRYGFNKGGIYFGWPSSHMMTHTAMITSFLSFYKDNIAMNIIGYTYLAYLFGSVISFNKSTMHWFSDAVAGTLMGYGIGSNIGANFRDKWDNHNKNEKISWMINALPDGYGLSFTWVF
jgi:hypothetical protein